MITGFESYGAGDTHVLEGNRVLHAADTRVTAHECLTHRDTLGKPYLITIGVEYPAYIRAVNPP